MLQLLRNHRLKRWQKNLNLFNHRAVFDALFAEVDGFQLSKDMRHMADDWAYTYGEIEFMPFIATLSLTHPDEQTVFYDLGSGLGKAVLACAMVYPVKKSVGIEYFANLHHAACTQQQQLQQMSPYHAIASQVHFINADFLTVNMDDATLVFINATAFWGDLWQKINLKLTTLPELKTVITISKPLFNKNFILAHETKAMMSWGVARVFIYKK